MGIGNNRNRVLCGNNALEINVTSTKCCITFDTKQGIVG